MQLHRWFDASRSTVIESGGSVGGRDGVEAGGGVDRTGGWVWSWVTAVGAGIGKGDA